MEKNEKCHVVPKLSEKGKECFISIKQDNSAGISKKEAFRGTDMCKSLSGDDIFGAIHMSEDLYDCIDKLKKDRRSNPGQREDHYRY
jgi:hypothetical protein